MSMSKVMSNDRAAEKLSHILLNYHSGKDREKELADVLQAFAVKYHELSPEVLLGTTGFGNSDDHPSTLWHKFFVKSLQNMLKELPANVDKLKEAVDALEYKEEAAAKKPPPSNKRRGVEDNENGRSVRTLEAEKLVKGGSCRQLKATCLDYLSPGVGTLTPVLKRDAIFPLYLKLSTMSNHYHTASTIEAKLDVIFLSPAQTTSPTVIRLAAISLLVNMSQPQPRVFTREQAIESLAEMLIKDRLPTDPRWKEALSDVLKDFAARYCELSLKGWDGRLDLDMRLHKDAPSQYWHVYFVQSLRN
ncbi:uncharacterized protein B0T23DRAFT_401825 [Neurospora hispaniola]|uniref:Uncharacterized protein n=1 Tax=Neurospora hispaniola TaxID=588809 RepID=A0AAJ0IHQ3_9PEZI|nr:hypothetical protein B0T23DRAFT_401825 [Neurospora hispaniola]